MKKMKNKTTIISTVLCLLPIVLAVLFYEQLPDQIAVHFDHAGNPDRNIPKSAAAFGLPVLFAVINLYTHFRLYNDPKVENSSLSLRTLSKWLIPALSLIMVPVTLFMALGKRIPVVMIAGALSGLVIIICGNYLSKCQKNYTIGIKLPWTLDSEDTWFHTHRTAGFVWVAGGIVIASNAFLGLPYLTIIIIACLLIIPFIDSYLFYQKQIKK